MKTTVNRIRQLLQKNLPEAKALLTGRMPSFVTQGKDRRSKGEIPVFVFHSVHPDRFEVQLQYLHDNGYTTLNADELETSIQNGEWNGQEVALTFDDATWTFWAYAFPLLKKYSMRAILFAIPGIIPEDSTAYPDLEDVRERRCSSGDLAQRGRRQPLCTWQELVAMHESGVVDVQSHSLTHPRIPISSHLVDFLHPDFDTGFYSNVDIPVSSLDDLTRPERSLRLGAPVFDSASRFLGRPRFCESAELIQALTAYVEKQGGHGFFGRPRWRKELLAIFKQQSAAELGDFETTEEMRAAIHQELTGSKEILEQRLSNKSVRHFCFPWFVGSCIADRMAADSGYRTLHYGLNIGCPNKLSAATPIRIRRISEEYLVRLPGNGRSSTTSIWVNRVVRFADK